MAQTTKKTITKKTPVSSDFDVWNVMKDATIGMWKILSDIAMAIFSLLKAFFAFIYKIIKLCFELIRSIFLSVSALIAAIALLILSLSALIYTLAFSTHIYENPRFQEAQNFYIEAKAITFQKLLEQDFNKQQELLPKEERFTGTFPNVFEKISPTQKTLEPFIEYIIQTRK
ncbi:hypothetical protein COB57_00785 [Candidatus Peregrinibacteria bacterium]|nr:MAG: hypothetical protein COB57_00785 [Candidatus Peregrinibacteria bacterium]